MGVIPSRKEKRNMKIIKEIREKRVSFVKKIVINLNVPTVN
jgi:hypothetical protein